MRRFTKVLLIMIVLISVCLGILGYLVLSKKPAVFKVSNLTLVPSEVAAGETVQISVIITNIGDSKGTYTLALKINNEIKETKEVNPAGGASQSMLFKFTPEKAGTYNVNVDGLIDTINVIEVPQIESVELYWEYKMNGIAADAKYKGHIISVSGIIINIRKSYIVLAGDPPLGVQCIISKEHEPRIAQLTIGEQVIVKGKCWGYLINVLLKDCSIVS